MSDVRLQRLADVLVNYSTQVQPGQWVGILGDVTVQPALRAVYAAVVRAKGHPRLMMTDDTMIRTLLREGSDAQVAWLDPADTHYYDNADAYIRVGREGATQNPRAMTSIPAARYNAWQGARSSWLNTRLSRAANGAMNWVGTWFPTQASAQEANMSLEDYEDFVYRACFCDRDDPVAAWRALHDQQQRHVDWLTGSREVHLRGPYADLHLSVAGRTWLNSSGAYNMPDGEIFTGPVEDSVNGWVRFSYPTIQGGRLVEGITLRFESGRVVEATAERGEDILHSHLDSDEGARRLGEFAIGTNYGVDRFTGNILFDEKIGGTVHMAVGRSYAETGGVNESAIHWDMICDMRHNSEIVVDGTVFYRNGQFVVS